MDRAVSLEARRVDLATEPPFCLGPTRIDPTGHQATVRGRSQRMQPQTLKVLIALHDKCGQAVTREELIERCWNGRVVGEDVINRCISILRRFSSEAGGFRIETVPRSGYRLIETPVAGSRSKPWRWAAMAAGLAIAAGGLYIVNEQRGQGDVDALTVAVLPLAEDSRGGDVHEVASATRASVSNDLAEGSYPASLVDQRSGAERADLIVSGDIRRAASAVEAFVQVEETRHGVVVYSHRFETDAKSANSLPDQIGASVAANLSWVATLMRLDRNRPSDPAVTAALLRAASLNVEAGDVLRAYEVARQIAPKAPNSAIAQISLASEAGSVLDELPSEQKSAAVAAGRQALDRALTLAPTFGDGYAVWCSLYGAAPIIRCEDHLRDGLRIDSSATMATVALSGLLDGVGRIDEALQFAQLSLAKDPYMPSELARVIRILDEQGADADADQLFRRSMRWWPNHSWIIWNRLAGIEFAGDYGALERFEREVANDRLALDREPAAELIGAVRSRDHARALRACRAKDLHPITRFLCMTGLSDLGESDRAFAIALDLFPPVHPRNPADAERAWLNRPGGFALAGLSAPAARSFRRNPRFLEIADGSGLLAYWRSGRLPDFCRTRPEPVCEAIVQRRG